MWFFKKSVDRILEPITNLTRVRSNVKISWTPSISKNIISQKIIITSHGRELLSKDLHAAASVFSFFAMRGTLLNITIMPFDGTKYGGATSIEIKV